MFSPNVVSDLKDTTMADLCVVVDALDEAIGHLEDMALEGAIVPPWNYLRTCRRQVAMIRQELSAMDVHTPNPLPYQKELPGFSSSIIGGD